jgi:hypothetical protein
MDSVEELIARGVAIGIDAQNLNAIAGKFIVKFGDEKGTKLFERLIGAIEGEVSILNVPANTIERWLKAVNDVASSTAGERLIPELLDTLEDSLRTTGQSIRRVNAIFGSYKLQ